MKPVREIIDYFNFSRDYQILQTESSDTGNTMLIQGLLMIPDKLNGNKRIYSAQLCRNIVDDEELQTRITNGEVMGECEHPNDGVTNLNRYCHIVKALWIGEDGNVYFKTLLVDTDPQGSNLIKCFKYGGRPGVSTRGRWESEYRNGTEYVKENYKFDTFDFVYQPSVREARPSVVRESLKIEERKKDKADMSVDLKQIQSYIDDTVSLIESAKTKAQLKKQLDRLLEHKITLSKAIANDPEIKYAGESIINNISQYELQTESLIKNFGKRINEEMDFSDLDNEEIDEMDDEDNMDDMGDDDSYDDDDMEEMDDEIDSEDFGSDDDLDEMDDEEDFDDNEDDDPMNEMGDYGESYVVDMQCNGCGCQKKYKAESLDKVRVTKSCGCQRGGQLQLESVQKMKQLNPIGCNHCGDAMFFNESTSNFKCESCQRSVPVLNCMTRNQLIEKYQNLVNVSDSLAFKYSETQKSNAILSERYEAAIKLVGRMVEKTEQGVINKAIKESLQLYPALRKVESILHKCGSISEVNQVVEDFMTDSISDDITESVIYDDLPPKNYKKVKDIDFTESQNYDGLGQKNEDYRRLQLNKHWI